MHQALEKLSQAHQAYIDALKNETVSKQLTVHHRQNYLKAKQEVDALHNEEVLACERNINLN